ncbi:alpha-ketoacid dehydrogenase subunit beta [Amycolatopsis sp. H20-H5]|uniref:alpha-ketoacid dehydrogenase subunit beta n=1 Tax=Amycolatopsis sp. H20-H5 TaxID=3046309 RepID=UPI002DBD8188|nr:transketolase C-terminal domain-containing protein [Amycolatopsis sp. H20-H5]MEC3976596.1 transketolase C-terminal domain-containing protein [Amycolatopsis sp. H20-H5]
MNVRQTTVWRALNTALHDAMREDERVFVMGEDITKWGTGGGIYGVTRKLVDEFGEERVRATPISEEAIVAAGVGAAMLGLRPVVELMYSDFTLLAMDGIVNQAAKAHYMFGGQFSVPMVLRTNGGAGIGKAGQHSQSLETLFAHIPGLEVVLPTTADDAYGLLRASIKTENPTIFLEHKALYTTKGPVTGEILPLGVPAVRRTGTDVTVVGTQQGVLRSLAAAERLSDAGVSAEVVDLRGLYPLDLDPVFDSVRRTRRLAVVHEACGPYGFGGEIVSRVVEACWSELDEAPVRVTAARSPIPYSEVLENAVVPQVDDVVRAVLALVGDRHAVSGA